ncbi:hypothetical protein GA0115253_101952 [Streptomyces sp. Termitarium-T10T-6]|nr:hypothetical protein GA0115253_101952 [Streptomyces sp. Termitarium-T10T-6]
MSGSFRAAAPGICGSHSGTRSGRTALRASRVTACSGASPTRSPTVSAAATANRAATSTARKFFAVSAAIRSSRGVCRRCRKPFIIAPVSMPTGQASLQVESPAQVSTAS